jgi:hypothetical protein
MVAVVAAARDAVAFPDGIVVVEFAALADPIMVRIHQLRALRDEMLVVVEHQQEVIRSQARLECFQHGAAGFLRYPEG